MKWKWVVSARGVPIPTPSWAGARLWVYFRIHGTKRLPVSTSNPQQFRTFAYLESVTGSLMFLPYFRIYPRCAPDSVGNGDTEDETR